MSTPIQSPARTRPVLQRQVPSGSVASQGCIHLLCVYLSPPVLWQLVTYYVPCRILHLFLPQGSPVTLFQWVPPCPFLPPRFLSSTKMLGIFPVLSATHPFCFISTASLPSLHPPESRSWREQWLPKCCSQTSSSPAPGNSLEMRCPWAHPHPAESEPSWPRVYAFTVASW